MGTVTKLPFMQKAPGTLRVLAGTEEELSRPAGGYDPAREQARGDARVITSVRLLMVWGLLLATWTLPDGPCPCLAVVGDGVGRVRPGAGRPVRRDPAAAWKPVAAVVTPLRLKVVDWAYRAGARLSAMAGASVRALLFLWGEGPDGWAAGWAARWWLSHRLVEALADRADRAERKAGPATTVSVRPWPVLRPLIPMEDDPDER
jgi:hypothetical protein